MKKSLVAAMVLTAIVAATPCLIAQAQLDVPRVSPKATVSQVVGFTEVKILYCRPGVKGRVIWGDLVPYDQVWRTGANEATTITFGEAVTVDGHPLAAGTYGLFTIPGKDEWTIIFNSGAEQWGAYEYKPEQDVLRIKVKPQKSEYTEWMTFSFPALSPESAEVALTWDRLKVAFTVKVDVVDKVLAKAREAMADWRTPFRAAMFCVENNVALPEAAAWIEKAVAINPSYYPMYGKARILWATGKKADAIATMEKAIELGKAAEPKADTAPGERFLAEWEKGKK
ncbi:MAG: DUF2911 domain-containing protein [Acidobacteriota bacterium]